MPDGTTPLSSGGYKVTWTDKQSGNASSVRLYVKQSEGYNLPCDKDGNLATLEPGSSVYSLCLNPDAMINEQQFFKLDVSTGKYTYTIQTGMEQGRNYNVEVAAVNEVCDGTPKAYSVATWTTPRAPRNLTVTPITASARRESSV